VAANYLQGGERRQIDGDLPKPYAVIQEAIERIEHALAEVLPQIKHEN
jgi:hypothetical protein